MDEVLSAVLGAGSMPFLPRSTQAILANELALVCSVRDVGPALRCCREADVKVSSRTVLEM